VKRFVPLLIALGAVAVVLVTYLALGGASYEPTPVADPCRTREWRNPGGVQAVLEQVALSALDGAACNLAVSREDLVIAFADESSLDAFAAEHGISRAGAENALHDGLLRALDDAEQAGALSGTVAGIIRAAVDRIPPRLILETLEQLRALVGG
jgi:hypothetical protein